jgi:2-polyprenyl-6-methoxyphenol hydroxylase-like FAD-dependent oxidoreductase
MAASAVQTRELVLLNRHGSVIWREPRGTAAGYCWAQLSIHRGALQAILTATVRKRLGSHAIATDSRVAGFTRRRDGRLRIGLAHRGGQSTSEIEADVLMGADGIHSTVRSVLYPQEGDPKWNGWVMWRGIAHASPYLTGASMVVSGDDALRIVFYPISAPPGTRSQLVNWVVACPADSQARHGGWSHASARERALQHCTRLSVDGLDVSELIRASAEVFEYPMVDRDPLPKWTFGDVTLLGDAAHPMYPAGSNGATQAIVDARALAYQLATRDDRHAALAAYETERRPAVSRIQRANRRMGPEAAINLVHELAPDGFTDIDEVISREELERVSQEYAALGGFAPETVNRPSPYSVTCHLQPELQDSPRGIDARNLA